MFVIIVVRCKVSVCVGKSACVALESEVIHHPLINILNSMYISIPGALLPLTQKTCRLMFIMCVLFS